VLGCTNNLWAEGVIESVNRKRTKPDNVVAEFENGLSSLCLTMDTHGHDQTWVLLEKVEESDDDTVASEEEDVQGGRRPLRPTPTQAEKRRRRRVVIEDEDEDEDDIPTFSI
jgi:hypothetical protein